MGTPKAPSFCGLSNERRKPSWECPPHARWCLQSLIARRARSRRPHLSAHFIKGGRQLFVGYRRARQRTRQTKLLYTALWFGRRCWTFLTQFGTMEHSIPGVCGAKQSNHLSGNGQDQQAMDRTNRQWTETMEQSLHEKRTIVIDTNLKLILPHHH